MSKNEAIEFLKEAGAVLEKREDRSGETKSGWWIDDVFLAPAKSPVDAVLAMRGG